MKFDERLPIAIGNWQRGWRENQLKREKLAAELESAAEGLPDALREVGGPCFRKRFIRLGENCDIFLKNFKTDGVASWTTDFKFAEDFKGREEPNTFAAIFEHHPTVDQVVVNIPKLWNDPNFVLAAEALEKSGNDAAVPLFKFRRFSQSEIVLRSSILKATQIVAIAGRPSDFDELCDTAGIHSSIRSDLYRDMVQSEEYPTKPVYLSREATQRALSNGVEKFYKKVSDLKSRSNQ